MTASAMTLGCPRCGAPASSDDVRCAHCGTALALVACPACFGRLFRGTRFCSHCGAAAARAEPRAERPARGCPRCKQTLAAVTVGAVTLDECARCGGVWAERAVFERILRDGEAQSAVPGVATPAPAAATVGAPQAYVPCPACGRLMNRHNFARCSGVLVDVCKEHGTWFDRDELARIVAFVREGGLSRARAKEQADLQDERRRLHFQEKLLAARQAAPPRVSGTSDSGGWAAVDLFEVIGSVAGALSDIID